MLGIFLLHRCQESIAAGFKAALFLILALFATSAAARDKPNIVFILADDMGYGELSSYNPADHTQELRAGPATCGFDSFFAMHASLVLPSCFYIHGDKATMTPSNNIEANNKHQRGYSNSPEIVTGLSKSLKMTLSNKAGSIRK
ncbi:hypothetical protein PQO03_16585 [Lentisphaera profundi]|uniref:Sulfatase N-terminal domain-containing protein n=1 Tax=Lentisphaera profundi TaxID=1658616 RepID=A0ABY7VYX5_9BACT|nr:hypothetical protein [Lentisphaera profundi]WDE99455.1 hypothetical protein PQO03_16585 [Lentisphaera profundi]